MPELLSPKQRLLANETLCDRIRKILHGADFEQATDTAKLQFIEEMGTKMDGTGAIADYYKLQGAIGFLRTLQTIADKSSAREPVTSGQLDYSAGMRTMPQPPKQQL